MWWKAFSDNLFVVLWDTETLLGDFATSSCSRDSLKIEKRLLVQYQVD